MGARILTQTGIQNRQKEIVDSSYDKARARGEKLAGKNSQQRADAYVKRLEDLVEKRGSEFEQKLWDASVDKVIIDVDDIDDNYWKMQEQILRDNGQGRELSDYEKEILTEDIQKQQWESAQEWANYLGDEQTPYPMWFKVYAWDGMSKMGVFDKNKGEYKGRDEHTVAPYPHLNQAVLGKVYEAIDDFYHRKTNGEGEEDRDKALDVLVQSGSFNRLYSKFLLGQKVIPKTPERTEDVRGEWVEYLPGQEEELAAAAEGTPWCVASPAVGRNYLRGERYGDDDFDEENDDWDEEYDDYDEGQSNQAKFILFHLTDPETGELADNACASIRLGLDGQVAEISGLNKGQALEDSLVPIVEEKVRTLPGGEDFLEAFADKQKLIELDRKMQRNETLTKDEIEFVFEAERPIKTLDTYNNEDPRISELRDYVFSNLTEEKIAEMGLNPDVLTVDVDEYFDQLIGLGIDANYLAKYLVASSIEERFDQLVELGVDVNILASKMPFYCIGEHFDELVDLGVDIDVLVNGLPANGVKKRFERLVELGADVDALAKKLNRDNYDEDNVDELFDRLVELGVGVNVLANELSKDGIDERFDKLVELGADVNVLVSRMYENDVGKHFERLVDLGADANVLMRNMSKEDISKHFDQLVELGIEASSLVKRMSRNGVNKHFDELVELGVGLTDIVEHLYRDGFRNNFSALLDMGMELDELLERAGGLSQLHESTIRNNIERLIAGGVDAKVLAKQLNRFDIKKYFYELAEAGADVNDLIGRMYWMDRLFFIENNIDRLFELGVSGDTILKSLQGDAIDYLDKLLDNGVGIEQLIEYLRPEDVVKNRKKLIESGASEEMLNSIVQKTA